MPCKLKLHPLILKIFREQPFPAYLFDQDYNHRYH